MSDKGEEKDIDQVLFNGTVRNLAADAQPEIAKDMYLAYLQYADSVSDRRMRTNSFFLSLQTGLFIFLGYIFSKDAAAELGALKWVIPLVGVVIGLFWRQLITSYRNLMTSKFDIIHRIEAHMPLAPYKAEWDVLAQGKDSSVYRPLTHIEVWIPYLFVVAHCVIFILWLPWAWLYCHC